MHQNICTVPDHHILETYSLLLSHDKDWLRVENFETNTKKTYEFSGEIEGVMISSDQASLLVYTSDGELATICSKTMNKTYSIKTKKSIQFALHLNPTGNILCVYEETGIEVFSPNFSEIIFKAPHNSDYLLPETLLSGQYVLCQEDSSTLEIWNIGSATSYFRISFDDAEISNLEITQNMELLSVTFEGGDYKIYRVPSGKCIFTNSFGAKIISFQKS